MTSGKSAKENYRPLTTKYPEGGDIMKGFISKVESLSDQSVKMSLHLPKELFLQAAALAYKEVTVKEFEATDVNKDAVLHLACESIKRIEELLIAELIAPDNAERREE